MPSSAEKVCKVLKCASALIRKGWTQRAYARTKSNKPVDAANRYAVKFCSIGAIQKGGALCGANSCEIEDAEEALRNVLPGWGVVRWNDSHIRTQAEVLEAFDRAIEKACHR